MTTLAQIQAHVGVAADGRWGPNTAAAIAKALGMAQAAPAPSSAPWAAAASRKPARNITTIAVHCTATPEGRHHTAADIRKWHLAQNWADIGYHFVVQLDGTVEIGRPLDQAGSHVAGHNSNSIGVVYVGGVAADAKTPKDTRTPEQKASLLLLLRTLKGANPSAVIQGHRDYPNVAKACPSFDAKGEYASL